MAHAIEKREAEDISEKRRTPSRSDESLDNSPEAAPEPKPDEPVAQDGWSAYWVRESDFAGESMS